MEMEICAAVSFMVCFSVGERQGNGIVGYS